MSKGLTRGLKSARLKGLPLLVQTIPFDIVVAITDPGAAAGFGTKPICRMPKGNWLFVAAVSNMILSDAGGVGLIAAFTGFLAIGTTATADATLTTTDRDIVGAAAAGLAFTAASGITPNVRGASDPGTVAGAVLATTPKIFDNTAGALNLNLNLNVADASLSAAASIRCRGTLDIVHAVMGGA